MKIIYLCLILAALNGTALASVYNCGRLQSLVGQPIIDGARIYVEVGNNSVILHSIRGEALKHLDQSYVMRKIAQYSDGSLWQSGSMWVSILKNATKAAVGANVVIIDDQSSHSLFSSCRVQ